MTHNDEVIIENRAARNEAIAEMDVAAIGEACAIDAAIDYSVARASYFALDANAEAADEDAAVGLRNAMAENEPVLRRKQYLADVLAGACGSSFADILTDECHFELERMRVIAVQELAHIRGRLRTNAQDTGLLADRANAEFRVKGITTVMEDLESGGGFSGPTKRRPTGNRKPKGKK